MGGGFRDIGTGDVGRGGGGFVWNGLAEEGIVGMVESGLELGGGGGGGTKVEVPQPIFCRGCL